jgi:hypothetical protein
VPLDADGAQGDLLLAKLADQAEQLLALFGQLDVVTALCQNTTIYATSLTTA